MPSKIQQYQEEVLNNWIEKYKIKFGLCSDKDCSLNCTGEVKFIKNLLKTALAGQLKIVEEEIKKCKCVVPPEPFGNLALTNEILLFVGRTNYNKALSDIQSLLQNK